MSAQALDAGSAAALPDGLRAELEQLEDHGGVRHLHDLAAQIKVCSTPLYFCHTLDCSAALNVRSTAVLGIALCALMWVCTLWLSLMQLDHAGVVSLRYSVGAEEEPAAHNGAHMHKLFMAALHLTHRV